MDRTAGRYASAFVLTVAIALSGCATTQPAQQVTQTAHTQAAQAAQAAPVARGAAPVPMTTARTMRPRPVALSDESAMRALDPAGVERLIGPPTFVRQDSGATIWQYSVDGCVMDLFWYRTDAGQALVHVEARNIHSPRTAEMQACLDHLWKARAAQAES